MVCGSGLGDGWSSQFLPHLQPGKQHRAFCFSVCSVSAPSPNACHHNTEAIIIVPFQPDSTMSEPSQTRTGACLCGRVKFTFEGSPLWNTVCYCLNCRRYSGSALYTAAICPKNVGYP